MRTTLSSAIKIAREAADDVLKGHESNISTCALGVALLALALAPFDSTQFLFMGIGAIFYALVQTVHTTTRRKKGVDDSYKSKSITLPQKQRSPHAHGFGQRQTKLARALCQNTTPATPGKEVKTATSMPIERHTFSCSGFEAEVSELVARIMPKPESAQVVRLLAKHVKSQIASSFPDAEVVGYASGDFRRGKAFGVAVPEVDIVIEIGSGALARRMQGRFQGVHNRLSSGKLDAAKLQKSMIRVVTEQLVQRGGFKFRRSAFRGVEPKVTMLAPKIDGCCDEAVPIDLSINARVPLHNMALLTESGVMEPRAKELILLVRRWSKDRGICHASKGHLSPYLWGLLTIYFLQVGVDDEGPLLPDLKHFSKSSGLMQQADPCCMEKAPVWTPPSAPPNGRKSVAALFKEFVYFYHAKFDWSKEAVCIRTGTRGPPALQLPLHPTGRDTGGCPAIGPSIEDPFDSTRNVCLGMNAASLARLHEELARANTMCTSDASLATLLELWSPPDWHSKESAEEGGDDA
mmetsp:Transcript_115191/g.325488  ORF Transcript_115191/g.325488 Transcript_115191/m.325488 type:complete len:521 (+) Transcript_115191:159-1721(+)